MKPICDYCGKQYDTEYRTYVCGRNTFPKDACKYCTTQKTSEMNHSKRMEYMKSKVLKQAKIKNYQIEYNWDDYLNQNSRINYICSKHGKQEMSCANFIKGYGCPKCGDESCSEKTKLSKQEVIDIIESIDGNELLNPEDYKGNRYINLLVRCCCGNTFYTSIAKYPKKYRCSICAKSESVGENKIKKFLEDNNISFTSQYKYIDCIDKRPLPFDFHLNDYPINIEFDGKQHFIPIYGQESLDYIQRHDAIKNKYCDENNIKLIRIDYLHYKDINEILTRELLTT